MVGANMRWDCFRGAYSQAQRIVRSANKLMFHIWSLRGVYYYARSTLRGLASLSATASRLLPGAIRNITDHGGLGVSGVTVVERLSGARRFRCFASANCVFGEGTGRSVYYSLDRPPPGPTSENFDM